MKELSNETPILEKSWEEFRNSGLLWAVNNLLHMFGWSLVAEIEDGEIKRVYPARTKYLAFSYELDVNGQRQLRKYMTEQGYTLFLEAHEKDGETENSSS